MNWNPTRSQIGFQLDLKLDLNVDLKLIGVLLLAKIQRNPRSPDL